jgi:hypothetical protein
LPSAIVTNVITTLRSLEFAEANQPSEAKTAAPITEINASRIEIKPAASSTNSGDVPREPTGQRATRNEFPKFVRC